ncbi:hypothetical protein NAEGRDRAFT_78818 [Naegleria gruberi]|uniref:DUF4116 domain-containing protein n=1 Tax=Naegleria gruberi TaxID=5762 RepID=D2V6T2_NAEGR|nr:uncharacterized protein NAEGRDRAFT_78818 [Naegleria gruberi]EFC47497.1 hypothetical protein NAEGRDRAFT_78818 [Naegleria gruberi]|eukprot:XP_002680241.1 hypothetical protein NAEGRDRAFT_78818 [Naegleria gruberi strain NEG-M]
MFSRDCPQNKQHNSSEEILLQQAQDDDEDLMINFCDFEFNLNLQSQIQDLAQIREFAKTISYYKHHDNNRNSYDLCNDDWFMILDFIPFFEFSKFALVCSSFAELLTFNRRYLVMRRILKGFPILLKDHHYLPVESLEILANNEAPSDDPSFAKSIYSDMINFLFEKRRYKKNMWKNIPSTKILEMDQQVFILPFRDSMIRKVFSDFIDIPQVLLDDRDFILKFFKSFPKAPRYFTFLNSKLMQDEEIAKMAVQSNGWFIRFVQDPTSEILNTAFCSRKRYIISSTSHHTFERYKESLIEFVREPFYHLLEQKSIVNDYRMSRKELFFKRNMIFDSKCGSKNAEFLLLFSFFEKSPEFKGVLLYFYNAKTSTEKYDHIDDLITDLLCVPEKFQPILSKPMLVPEELKCKTREITMSTMLKNILDDNFTFDNVMTHDKKKLTTSSIEYLRERLIQKMKPTPLFTGMYFGKKVENIDCENESEKIKLLNEISKCRGLNMKMLKYYPKHYVLLDEEIKQDEEFKRIAMRCLKFNAQYFDFSKDDMLVLLLSANVKVSVEYLKKQSNWSSTLERINNIFTTNGRIRSNWLTWPQVYCLYRFLLCYSFNRDKLFTLEDQVKMIDYIPPKHKKLLLEYSYEECLMEKIRLKNLVQFDFYDSRVFLFGFRYMISYKSINAICRVVDGSLIKFQQSDRLLSEILKVTPKFIKVFMEKRPKIYRKVILPPYPVELVIKLALENPRIIHYLPRNIQSHPLLLCGLMGIYRGQHNSTTGM